MGTTSWFRVTTTRPVAVTMLVIAAIVFGFVGLSRLPVNLLPDISYPTVTIRTEYPGASPEDVEDRVSDRIQESVAVVAGVRRVVSVSRPGVSDVLLEFVWGTQMVFAISDIRERLDRVILPDEAERPLVLRYDPSLDPILTLGLAGDADLVELRRVAEEELERELQKIDGVAAIKIRGGDEEEIRIVVDEPALTVLGLDVDLISRRLAAENVNTAAGSIDEGDTEFLVRTLGEFGSLQEIEDIILERRNDGVIRLRDVASIVRVPREKEVISRVDGAPCVLIDIYREAEANVVALAERVRERTFGTAAQQAYVAAQRARGWEPGDPPPEPQLAPGADPKAAAMAARQEQLRHKRLADYLALDVEPIGARITLLQDQSQFISDAIADVLGSAWRGGLFAIVVILLFLRRWSATLILATSIPVSLLAAFAPMFLSGITLNIMSLGGLALGVGMLVDNSIVVLESIYRAREEGLGLADAAVTGASRVGSAVTASTLTTIAVFFPIVFVEGVAGQLFRDQSLTVVYSLLISLIAALMLIPMLASRGEGGLRATTTPASAVGRGLQRAAASAIRLGIGTLGILGVALRPLRLIGAAFDAAYRRLDAAYPAVVRAGLRRRWLVAALAGALLAIAGSRIGHLGSELIPEVSQGELFVELFLPRDSTVERTDATVAPIERAIAAMPEVAATFLAVGVDPEELNSSEEGEHSSKILVRLGPGGDHAAREERLRERIRVLLEATPEIRQYRFSKPSVLAFNAPLVVEVVGRDLIALREVSAEVEDRLRTVDGLRDVHRTMQRGNPEIVLRLDRDQMSALGIDSGVVTRILQTKVLGDVPTRFPERQRKIDMRVALSRQELSTVSRLLEINVNPNGFPAIPLRSIAEVVRQEGPSEIRRIGNVRGAEVRAAVAGLDLGSMQARVEDAVAAIETPRGIEVRLGGQKEEMARSLDSLRAALLLAVFLVYIVMASQFESLVKPFVILLTLPLALVGVVFTLDVLAIPISVIALLGAIVLAGIVVNNAIIMVDQINRLRAEGMAKAEAIVEGARTRLRPVLMTTSTTVLGLLPLTGWLQGIPVLGGSGDGIELRAPMAITVISGLIASTLLTLIVIPVAYSMSDRRP